MATKTHDLCVAVSTYEKDGQSKNRYLNVGSLMLDESEDGKSRFILMDRTFNPAGVKNPDNRENLLISIFEAKKKDDIPF